VAFTKFLPVAPQDFLAKHETENESTKLITYILYVFIIILEIKKYECDNAKSSDNHYLLSTEISFVVQTIITDR